jgi:hypothetical protein
MCLAALLCCSAAKADTFSFNFSGTGFSGTGTFTATATGTSGEYLINQITGTTNGVGITGLLSTFSFPPIGDLANDNYLYYPLINGGALDTNGLSFQTGSGAGVTDYNIYYLSGVPAGTYDLISSAFPPTDNNPNNYPTFTLDSFSIVDTTTGTPITTPPTGATPEPGSLVLLATGVLCMAGTMRRRLSV